MKTNAPSLALALLLLAIAALPGTPAAHGQTVGPNPPAMVITTSPYVINGSGFYQLGANLTYNGNGSANDAIITINAPNVTLDLGGHYISGPSNDPATRLYGVFADGQANVTVQNGTVSHCYAGIFLTDDTNTPSKNLNPTIRNVLVTHGYAFGITVVSAVGATITGNTVSNLGGSDGGSAVGILVSAGSDATVSNNTIATVTASSSSNALGINCVGASSAGCNDNTISNVTAPGGATAYGIFGATFAVGNSVSMVGTPGNAASGYGLNSCTKYKDNLTNGCGTSYSGGTAVGVNQ